MNKYVIWSLVGVAVIIGGVVIYKKMSKKDGSTEKESKKAVVDEGMTATVNATPQTKK